MTKFIATHAVADVARWKSFDAERAAVFALRHRRHELYGPERRQDGRAHGECARRRRDAGVYANASRRRPHGETRRPSAGDLSDGLGVPGLREDCQFTRDNTARPPGSRRRSHLQSAVPRRCSRSDAAIVPQRTCSFPATLPVPLCADFGRSRPVRRLFKPKARRPALPANMAPTLRSQSRRPGQAAGKAIY